uniref:Reverse transcriptase domain-containing protein n=1 Tax=Tanacetum cinerariifolium TaxID=118510 RepID=A0A6L2KGS0_TANCI|nr:reverse transcriptase domain-containing protein [Tanacetum cinerariifolium]
MTAHHNDWDTSAQRSESSSSITFSFDQEIVALKAKMAEINKNLMKVLQINQQVKAVTPSCETCGGPHSYNDCPATIFQIQNVYAAGAYQGSNSYQQQVVQTKTPVLNSELLLLPLLLPCRRRYLRKKVGKFHFPADFVVVDFDADPRVPLILESSFIKTGRALIYVYAKELTLRVNNEVVTFNLDQTSRYSAIYNDMTANRIDVIDMACKEYSQEVLGFSDVIASGNPTPYYDPIISTFSLTLNPFGDSDFLLEEVDAFLSLEDDPTLSEVDHSYYYTKRDILLLEAFLIDDPSLTSPNQGMYLPQVQKELKICKAKKDKSLMDEPPKVKLKDLTPHLKYIFLEGDDKFPIIIAKYLSVEEKAALIKVLKSHKQAIAWKLFDIKSIDSKFCTHKILSEDDFDPTVQHQRRVNPKVYDVIKKEVLKLPDAGLIYPISDSPWEKSHFMVKEGIILGHKISKNGIEVDKAKVDVIANLPHPTTVKALKYLFNKKDDKPRLLRWVLPLQEFDIIVRDKKEAENIAADHLSRLENPHQSVLDKKEINETFPLETLSMVEAKALPTNDAQVVCKFCKSLFARFGTPRAIISDHDTDLCNDQFAKVMLKYGVTHRLATVYHPQTSGQVEVSNRGLKRILERTVGENHASRSDKLDDSLWAFRTAFKTPIGCTPYKLVYWALKYANFDLQTTGDHRKVQLNELNDLRDHAYENSLIYKEKTKRIHDSKIKDRVFNVGDRVLLFNSKLKIFSGKLKTRWSRPFTITPVFPYGTVELSQTDGTNFKKFKIQQYLQNEHYALWEVIEFGESYKAPVEETSKEKGNDVKARTTLVLALPDEHQLRFSKYETVKELWEAILKTFGVNEATKKTKKNQLKQQYDNFKAKGLETLEQTFNRLQAIVSHLEFMDVEIKQDDLNQKFLTSLAPEWPMYIIVWINRDDLNTMSLDDVYNHLKVGKDEVHTASVPTASTQVSTASTVVATAGISHDTVYAYIASQSNGSQIKYEDITQIDECDIKEIDIKWNIALLSMRADMFWKKTGKKITIQGTDVASFDKSNVECFNCHEICHFAREYRAHRSQDRGRRKSYKQGSKEEEPAPKVLMAIDGIGWD